MANPVASTAWPVNSNNEIVAQAGVGNSTVVGFLSEQFIMTDPATGAVVIAGLGGGGGSSGTPTVLTTSRAAVAGDNGNTLTNATAGTIIITINSGMPSGFGLAAAQLTALGSVQFVAGSGVTINNVSGFNRTSSQYGVMSLLQVGANAYIVNGATAI